MVTGSLSDIAAFYSLVELNRKFIHIAFTSYNGIINVELLNRMVEELWAAYARLN